MCLAFPYVADDKVSVVDGWVADHLAVLLGHGLTEVLDTSVLETLGIADDWRYGGVAADKCVEASCILLSREGYG